MHNAAARTGLLPRGARFEQGVKAGAVKRPMALKGRRSGRCSSGLAVALLLFLGSACGPTLPAPFASKAASVPTASPTDAPALTPNPEKRATTGWIAFFNENNVWLIHPDGSGLQQITHNPTTAANDTHDTRKMRWSPDGKSLAFSEGGAINILNMGTLTTTQLIDDSLGGFDWSTTGAQMVYDVPMHVEVGRGTYVNSGLWVVNPLSGVRTLLVKTSDEIPAIFDPQWSFDGTHVIFRYPGGYEMRGFGAAEISTGEPTQVAFVGGAGTGGCSWRTHATMIACIDYVREEGYKPAVLLMEGDGMLRYRIPIPEEARKPFLGPWSPDGSKLAVLYTNGTIDANNVQRMTDLLYVDTGYFQTLGRGYATDWSPDGRWIVTEDYAEASQAALLQMHVVDTQSGHAFPLSDGQLAVWQP
jgi:dipeptidyl aminopeptidase/acylaminoacyl peptidase